LALALLEEPPDAVFTSPPLRELLVAVFDDGEDLVETDRVFVVAGLGGLDSACRWED